MDAIKPYFNSLALENQDILGSDEKLNAALALITDESLRKDVEERIKDPRGPDDSVVRCKFVKKIPRHIIVLSLALWPSDR